MTPKQTALTVYCIIALNYENIQQSLVSHSPYISWKVFVFFKVFEYIWLALSAAFPYVDISIYSNNHGFNLCEYELPQCVYLEIVKMRFFYDII